MEASELLALAEKLTELIALRELGADDPPRDRLRALATRFPGALRELDHVPLATLIARREALNGAIGGGAIPTWAKAMSRYHGWLRIGLRLRAEATRTEAGAIAWAEAYVPVFPGDPPRARLEPTLLRLLVAPPDGRLVAVASSLAAEEAELTREAFDLVLYGR